MADAYNLARFVEAQATVYETAVAELTAGRKRSHWIWFIFPQVAGLGHSAMSHKYAIASRSETKAFLEHPVLGARLRECTQLVLNVEGRRIEEIFPYPDDLKFGSSMTLFAACGKDSDRFQQAIDKYFGGRPDQQTLDILAKLGS
ncbi:MAG TPA: DUF1810 domain-containing protein [Phycisphaerae bacterium]|nr:DUF1810 domain-containing protein [Phycisphaerae bacterium]